MQALDETTMHEMRIPLNLIAQSLLSKSFTLHQWCRWK